MPAFASGAKSDLNALADSIRRILPSRPPITNLQVLEEMGHVSFHWQAKDFAVDKRMHVFELKGKRLFVTASSILLQSVLQKKDKNRRVIEAVIEVLSEVQHMINSKNRVEMGVNLLRTTQSTLQKLIIARRDEKNLSRSKSSGNTLPPSASPEPA